MIELLERLLGAPVAFEELKRKPGRRQTWRVRGALRDAIVKVYESERASVVGARVSALAAGPPELLVPNVLLVEPTRRLVVLSDVPGVPLRDAILAGDAGECMRAGVALGSWHLAWEDIAPPTLRPHLAEHELEILLSRAASASSSVAATVRSAARSLDGEWPCSTVVHRDLYEEQILLDERVGLIDLDDAALGPPELDLGNLIGHIELLGLRSPADLAPMSGALLAGYAVTGPPLATELLDRCRRLTLLRLACIHRETALLHRAAAPWPLSLARHGGVVR